MERTGKLFLLSFLSLAFCVAQEVFYPLLDSNSRDLTVFLQKQSSEPMDDFSLLVGLLCLLFALSIGPIDYLVFDKSRGILGTLAGYGGIAISAILKIYYCHPRPFWEYKEIKAVNCLRG